MTEEKAVETTTEVVSSKERKKSSPPSWLTQAMENGEVYVRRIFPHWSGDFGRFLVGLFLFAIAYIAIFYVTSVKNLWGVGEWANGYWLFQYIPYYDWTFTLPQFTGIPLIDQFLGGTYTITSRQSLFYIGFTILWWILFALGDLISRARYSMYLTDRKICGRKGWINSQEYFIQFRNVEALTIKRSWWNKAWHTGTVKIFTEAGGKEAPVFALKNVKEPLEIAQYLRTVGARINPVAQQ